MPKSALTAGVVPDSCHSWATDAYTSTKILGIAPPCRLVDMIITTDLVEAFLKCPTKCFLRSLGETGVGNQYADWVRALSTAYQRDASTRFM